MFVEIRKIICALLAAAGFVFMPTLKGTQEIESEYDEITALIEKKQFKEASALLEDPLRRQEPEAFYYAGMICVYQKDTANALRRFEKGSELQDLNCMYKLAHMYALGIGIAKDPAKAFHLLKKVADRSGHREALFQTGRMLLLGEGTAPDTTEALLYLRRAGEPAENFEASPKAQLLLGAFYREKVDQEKDADKKKELLNEAVRFLKYAAANKESEAWITLGGIYYQGVGGVTPDKSIAELCYSAAASHGSAKGFYNLGVLAIDRKNFDEALMWMKKAAELGDTQAVRFVEKDYPKYKKSLTMPRK